MAAGSLFRVCAKGTLTATSVTLRFAQAVLRAKKFTGKAAFSSTKFLHVRSVNHSCYVSGWDRASLLEVFGKISAFCPKYAVC